MPDIAASLSFHPTAKPFVMCHAYGTTRTPILTVQDAHASLAITAREDLPAAEHLHFARQLVAAATAYLAAVETYTDTDKEN